MSTTPLVVLQHLRILEPNAQFNGKLPHIHSSSGKAYFVKVGSVSEKDQYIGEAESLKAMNVAAPGLAPQIFVAGVSEDIISQEILGRPYFISEYKNFAGLTNEAAAVLGKRLATEMHRYKSTNGFGFHVPTYCGATRLENGWFETWEACYSAMIKNLIDQLAKKSRSSKLCNKAEQVRLKVIPALLRPLVIQPVLLHGDMWSGNTGTDLSTGQPVIFDPSSYYGHNEADLSIARMFGGISETFFKTYHEHHPKSEPTDQYDFRTDLYEMFHYLNHTLLFGGSYAGGALAKIDRLLESHTAGEF